MDTGSRDRGERPREHPGDRLASELREAVRRIVLEAGFDRVGFASAGPAPGSERLRRWMERGFAGTMAYMERSPERRSDPTRILDGARTVISAALHYPGPGAREQPGPSGRAEIASYARGTDYHRVMETRLRRASMALQGAFPARYRHYVDTGPILERDWAEQAGIGWIGKNTCSIDPERGSYFFLGEILTTLALDPDLPAANHCGACRSCLDACPTGALVNPYELDARLCISYLTIEHRGAVPEALEPSSGNLVFGCDICQEVCPFNRPDGGGNDGRPARAEPELAPRRESISPSLESLAALDEEGFRRRFPRSAVRRAKFEGFLRNVIVALGNSRSRESAEILERLSKREDVSESQVLSTTLQRAQDRCRP